MLSLILVFHILNLFPCRGGYRIHPFVYLLNQGFQRRSYSFTDYLYNKVQAFNVLSTEVALLGEKDVPLHMYSLPHTYTIQLHQICTSHSSKKQYLLLFECSLKTTVPSCFKQVPNCFSLNGLYRQLEQMGLTRTHG